MKNTIKIQGLNIEVKVVGGIKYIPESEAFRIQNNKKKGRQISMEKICDINQKAVIGGRLFHALIMQEDKRENLIKCATTKSSLGF